MTGNNTSEGGSTATNSTTKTNNGSNGGKRQQTSSTKKTPDCPLFLRKAYHMVDNCDVAIASWSEEGDTFAVKNVEEFSSKILPQYFKHNNFSSFVRQLNFYGFKKEKTESLFLQDDSQTSENKFWRFRHEHFLRDRPDLLVNIYRRVPNHNRNGGGGKKSKCKIGGKENGSTVSETDLQERKALLSEVATLQARLDLLQVDMNKINHIVKEKTRDIEHQQRHTALSGPSALQLQDHSKCSTVKNAPLEKKRPISSLTTESLISTTPLTQSQALQFNEATPDNVSSSYDPTMATSALPDLAMATDEDLLIEDVSSSPTQTYPITYNTTVPNSYSARSEIFSGLSDGTQELVDQMLIDLENDLHVRSNGNFAYEIEQEPLPNLLTKQSPIENPQPLLDTQHIQNLDNYISTLTKEEQKKFVGVVLSRFNDPEGFFKELKKKLVQPSSDSSTSTAATCTTDPNTENANNTPLKNAKDPSSPPLTKADDAVIRLWNVLESLDQMVSASHHSPPMSSQSKLNGKLGCISDKGKSHQHTSAVKIEA